MKNYLDRYLAGEVPLHPERLELPTDEELDAAEAAFDQFMADRESQTVAEDKPRGRVVRLWPWAAAASLFLIIGIGAVIKFKEPQKTKLIPAVAQKRPTAEEVKAVNPEEKTLPDTSQPKPQIKRRKAVAKTQRELPDTLGNGIWQRRENVVRAMQLLSECEADIRREEQEVRNAIIEATFRATPQPANVRLVTNEAGDCEVIETKTLVEI